jgi:hypothetical protein
MRKDENGHAVADVFEQDTTADKPVDVYERIDRVWQLPVAAWKVLGETGVTTGRLAEIIRARLGS